MKIARIEPIAVRLPMTRPMKMAGVEIRTADNLLVRIDADNGLTGWGEAASAPTMTGEFVEGMVAAVRYLAPTLTGANFEDLARIAMQLDMAVKPSQSSGVTGLPSSSRRQSSAQRSPKWPALMKPHAAQVVLAQPGFRRRE